MLDWRNKFVRGVKYAEKWVKDRIYAHSYIFSHENDEIALIVQGIRVWVIKQRNIPEMKI